MRTKARTMPLLKRKPFKPLPLPENFDPDEKYFVCKATGEAFERYEDFYERVIICNSLVWSCSITGRPGLTFSEAQACEGKALHIIQRFPRELSQPVLYLARLTRRTRINDMNDDVYNYIKDLYFVGETVEAIYKGEWWEAKVDGTFMDGSAVNGKTSNGDSEEELAPHEPDLEHIRYRVKIWDDETDSYIEGSEGTITVDTTCIRREKNSLNSINQDKCKLFLKYHCEPNNGIWAVKDDFVKKYSLDSTKFDQFCCLPEPRFAASSTGVKRQRSLDPKSSRQSLEPELEKDKKRRSEDTKKVRSETTMDPKPSRGDDPKPSREKKFAKEREKKLTPEEKASARAALKEAARAEKARLKEALATKIAEERAKLKELREKEKQQARVEKRLQADQLREWARPRDDLLCDDLVAFPPSLPVPKELSGCFGDLVMVHEFLSAFGGHLDLEDRFPGGISVDVVQKALLDSDINGPLTELLCFFLSAIFSCLEEEEAEESQLSQEEERKLEAEDGLSEVSYKELISNATLASQTCQVTHGISLREFPLDSLTVSEILRLHILASGAKGSSASMKFRYQNRGGYSSLDDAGLELKKEFPHIIRALSTGNVFDLVIEDKLRILSMLILQLLSFASLRDVIEESMDNVKAAKQELKQLQWGEQRRDREGAQQRQRKRLDQRFGAPQTGVIEDMDMKMDVDAEKDKPNEQLNDDDKAKEMRKLIKKLLAETAKLDPKHLVEPTVRTRKKNSTADEPSWADFDTAEWNSLDETYLTLEEKEILDARRKELETRKKQDFLERETELQDRISSLQRTVGTSSLGRDRWGRLYWTFSSLPGVYSESGSDLIEHPTDCGSSPHNGKENVPMLTPSKVIAKQESVLSHGTATPSVSFPNSSLAKDPSYHEGSSWVYFNTVASYEHVLNSLNSRGVRESSLKQKLLSRRRFIQRNLEANSGVIVPEYVRQDVAKPSVAATNIKSKSRIAKGLVKNTSAHECLELNLREMLLDLEERIFAGGLGSMKISNRATWREALEGGSYDAQDKEFSSPVTSQEEIGADTDVSVVRDLSRALAQIAKAVENKYLSKPLGTAEADGTKKKVSRKKVTESPQDEELILKQGKTTLERWTESLLASSSLPQIFLHLSTLESSIIWSKSALNARCHLCRRKGDGENMLLCDACDRGHHMYCLKPPVKDVPKGDWFCPSCRPEQSRTPRRNSRRRSFVEADDGEESSQDTASDQEQMDDSESVITTEESVYEGDTITSSEDEIQHPKIKLLKGRTSPNSSVSSKTKKGRRSGTATPDRDQGRSRRSQAPSPESLPPRRKSKGSRNASPVASRRSDSKRLSDKARNSLASARSNISEEMTLMSSCEALVKELTNLDDCWPFLAPVNRREVPDYYTIIKNPMDFQTINSKIKMVKYTSVDQLIEDVRLVFKNCAVYNEDGSEVYKLGARLSRLFEKKVKDLKLDQTVPAKRSRRN